MFNYNYMENMSPFVRLKRPPEEKERSESVRALSSRHPLFSLVVARTVVPQTAQSGAPATSCIQMRGKAFVQMPLPLRSVILSVFRSPARFMEIVQLIE